MDLSLVKPKTDWPPFFVVMRNHNAYPLTSESLDSLYNLSYPNFKIIVVDDGSSDDSAEKIKNAYPKTKVLQTGKYLEYCKSLNLGIKEALGLGAQFVFVVNNDTKGFSLNYLEEVLRVFQSDPKIGLVGSKVFNYEGMVLWNGSAKEKLGVSMETPTEGFVIKKEVFEKVGFLNERLVRYFEDLDFIIRLRLAGFKTQSTTNIHFYHLCNGTSGKQKFIPNYYRVRNIFLFLRKHCSDKPFSWKLRKFKSFMGVHKNKLTTALKQLDIISALAIFISICLGLMSGLIVRWKENDT